MRTAPTVHCCSHCNRAALRGAERIEAVERLDTADTTFAHGVEGSDLRLQRDTKALHHYSGERRAHHHGPGRGFGDLVDLPVLGRHLGPTESGGREHRLAILDRAVREERI